MAGPRLTTCTAVNSSRTPRGCRPRSCIRRQHGAVGPQRRRPRRVDAAQRGRAAGLPRAATPIVEPLEDAPPVVGRGEARRGSGRRRRALRDDDERGNRDRHDGDGQPQSAATTGATGSPVPRSRLSSGRHRPTLTESRRRPELVVHRPGHIRTSRRRRIRTAASRGSRARDAQCVCTLGIGWEVTSSHVCEVTHERVICRSGGTGRPAGRAPGRATASTCGSSSPTDLPGAPRAAQRPCLRCTRRKRSTAVSATDAQDGLRRGVRRRRLDSRAPTPTSRTCSRRLRPGSPTSSRRPLRRLRAVIDRRLPRHTANTRDGARSNIAAHYDMSNDLFAAFLDPSMTYSSAWFDERAMSSEPLEAAQLRKIDGILDYAEVGRGDAGPRDRLRAGARSRSEPPSAARASPRSRCRRSRPSWPPSASRTVGSTTWSTIELVDYRDVARRVRRDRQRRDDRGGRRGVLAGLLRDDRPAARPGRPGGDPGDHDEPPADARDPELVRLDPEVHLPRRADPVAAGDRRGLRRPTRRCGSPTAASSACTTPRRFVAGGHASCDNWPEIARQGFDDGLPPHLGVLPRVLRGGLRDRATWA